MKSKFKKFSIEELCNPQKSGPLMVMEIGKRIKEERKKHKLTLQALADKIGTTKSYMWELENTETPNPTLRILVGLSKELNVSIDYLAKGENQQGSGSTEGRANRVPHNASVRFGADKGNNLCGIAGIKPSPLHLLVL